MLYRGHIKNGIVTPDEAFPWAEGTQVVVVPAHRKSLKDLLGLLHTDQPPPSDDACDRILEDELLQKHGT